MAMGAAGGLIEAFASLQEAKNNRQEKLSEKEALKAGIRLVNPSRDSNEYYELPYQNVHDELEQCGFEHIVDVPLMDLRRGFLHRREEKLEGLVTEVAIAGKNSFSSGKRFREDAQITIKYHSFKNQ